MKAAELVEQLLDAIAQDGDKDVWLSIGKVGVLELDRVYPDPWAIYLRDRWEQPTDKENP